MADPRPVFAVVLAGGRGIRMASARPKPLHEIGGRSLIERVLDVVRDRTDRAVVSTNAPEAFAHLGLPLVADEEPGFSAGPIAGLAAAAGWFAARAEGDFHLLSVASDTPFLPADLVARLVEGAGDTARVAVASRAGRLHPIVALWPSAIVRHLRIDPSGPRRGRSLRAIQDAHGCRIVEFPADAGAPGADPFFNVNTPDDLALARRWVESAG